MVVLLILTGSPVVGVVCAMQCEPSTTASASAAHHGCQQTERPAGEAQLDSASRQDCRGHVVLFDQPVATSVDRVAARANPAASADVMPLAGPALPSVAPPAPRTAPPGSAPPTSRPVVLRV